MTAISLRLLAAMSTLGQVDVPKPTKPTVARNGMVATSQVLACDVGLEVLRAGGNAVDAAIAIDATLGVVEPMSCGIGGDLFAIVWDAKTKKIYGLNASGRAPLAATRAYFKQKGLAEIPDSGPLSWSVPGCVDGWETLRARFGSMPLAEILAPAIKVARGGFVVTPIIGEDWKHSEKLLRKRPESAMFLKADGTAPGPGDTISNPALAKTYERIAREGARSFYSGAIADKLAEFSEMNGGLLSHRDLEEHSSTWVEPVSTTYRGYEVWELPPPGQGIAALQILNILEPFDIKGMGQNSPAFLHHFIEAKKLAFEDRARFYADPAWERDLPIKEMISKPYAARRRARLKADAVAKQIPVDDPRLTAGDTIYLTVVDKDRNAVSFIQSIYYGWGSGVPGADLGFFLQNRGCLFALDEKHANKLEPGKRPFHTIIPGMVTKDGKPWLSFGVMGGDMQPQGHAQVLINMIDHGMDPQAAGAAPRVRHYGSSAPTGSVMTDGGQIMLEDNFPAETAAALSAKGHRVNRGGRDHFGGYQAIRIDEQSGELIGGSDPRKDGKAVGY